MSEQMIQKQIIQYLRYLGAWVQRLNSGSITKAYKGKDGGYKINRIKLADEGSPDIIAILPPSGQFIAIEVKKDSKEIEKWKKSFDKDRRSAAQHYQMDLIRQAGGIPIITYSLDDLIAQLAKLDKL